MKDNTQTDLQPAFHIGLVMAGAVSAGAYTGGVMDYLFETLDLWERAKTAKLKGESIDGIDMDLVPMHQVVIDAIGGTSAGGMTTAMGALYALEGRVEPIQQVVKSDTRTGNIFYDSWVQLEDTGETKKTTLEKMLETDDLETGFTSLLNSRFIDSIANREFSVTGDLDAQMSRLPSYISQELEMLIAHSMLRGIPLEVSFPNSMKVGSRSAPTHTTFEHFMMSHFKLSKQKPPESYLWLNPYDRDALMHMKESAKATGAFPVGLQYRMFDKTQFSTSYLKAIVKRILFRDFGKDDPESDLNPHEKVTINWDNFPEDFKTATVDGGAINNEVYAEVGSIVRARVEQKQSLDPNLANYAVVMIDPFPDRPASKEKNSKYRYPKGLFQVIPEIIGMLWDQSKVKRHEIIEQNTTDHFRSVIFPVKYDDTTGKALSHPIASESLGAFGGFISKAFREHDFHLGRNNARNFIRYWFSLKCSMDGENVVSEHPIHAGWTQEMKNHFVVFYEGKPYLPIVPDLTLQEKDQALAEKRSYTISEMPQFDGVDLLQLQRPIQKRISRILEMLVKEVTQSKPVEKNYPLTDQLIHQSKVRNVIGTILNGGIRGVFYLTKKPLAKKITYMVLQAMAKDLEDKELLVLKSK